MPGNKKQSLKREKKNRHRQQANKADDHPQYPGNPTPSCALSKDTPVFKKKSSIESHRKPHCCTNIRITWIQTKLIHEDYVLLEQEYLYQNQTSS